jgi:putative redox protein
MPTKEAVLQQVKGSTFAAKANSGHWVIMDTVESVGGNNGGSTPKELLLFALAGCTATDVVSILQKKRAPLEDFEMRVTAREAESHPKVFTDIHIEYILRGEGINPLDVERAIELSTTTYCSVSAMLRASVKITHAYRIELPLHKPTAIGR